MKAILKELVTSKRFLTTVVSLVVAAAARFGLHLDGDSILAGLGLVSTWLISQGLTDNGKSAAVLNMKTAQMRIASLSAPSTLNDYARPKEAGYVAAPILVVVAFVGVLAACATVSRDTKIGAGAFASCAKSDVGQLVADGESLISDVGKLITGNAVSLSTDLDALALQVGGAAVKCAVASVVAVLDQPALTAKTSQPLPGVVNAQAWLAAHP